MTDNPLLFINAHTEDITVLSGGNFHGEPLAIAMDYLGLAVSKLGNISERRLMRLTAEASNTHVLPAFLTPNGGLNSGFMIVQYTAAAALATENKVLSHPASVDTIPTSANVEDHVSMGCTAALKARAILDNVERILALELMAAAQGIDFRKQVIGAHARLGQGTGVAYRVVRGLVPFIEPTRYCIPTWKPCTMWSRMAASSPLSMAPCKKSPTHHNALPGSLRLPRGAPEGCAAGGLAQISMRSAPVPRRWGCTTR